MDKREIQEKIEQNMTRRWNPVFHIEGQMWSQWSDFEFTVVELRAGFGPWSGGLLGLEENIGRSISVWLWQSMTSGRSPNKTGIISNNNNFVCTA